MLSLSSVRAHGARDPSPSPFTPLCLSACAVPSPCSTGSLAPAWCWQGRGDPARKATPLSITTDCAFTLTKGAFSQLGLELCSRSSSQAALSSSASAHRGVGSCWHPKGEPAAPRLSLKGSSTLSTCSSSPALPGVCWAATAALLSLLHPAGKLPLLAQHCLELFCSHSGVSALRAVP